MKKLLFLVLAIALIINLAACGDKKEEKSSEDDNEIVTEEIDSPVLRSEQDYNY